MTAEQLLEKLKMERERLESSISVVEGVIKLNKVVRKRVAIVEAAKEVKNSKPTMKGHNYNGQHWMQKPENKHKVDRMIARMQRANRRLRS